MTAKKELITVLTREEMFKNECQIINLNYEYPGYTGTENYGIITSLSEEELMTKYTELLLTYRPFILLNGSYGEVRDSFWRNDTKHRMRAVRTISIFDINDDFEEHHFERFAKTTEEICQELESTRLIYEAIDKLTAIQKRRITKYFFEGKTLREIAAEESVSFSKIQKSIDIALEKLKFFLI